MHAFIIIISTRIKKYYFLVYRYHITDRGFIDFAKYLYLLLYTRERTDEKVTEKKLQLKIVVKRVYKYIELIIISLGY